MIIDKSTDHSDEISDIVQKDQKSALDGKHLTSADSGSSELFDQIITDFFTINPEISFQSFASEPIISNLAITPLINTYHHNSGYNIPAPVPNRTINSFAST